MTCPACNVDNDADAVFCKHCGASLSASVSSAGGSAPVFAGSESNYSLTLTDPGPNKIDVIKLIREIMSASLLDAKNAVDQSGGTFHSGLSQEVANHIAERLRAAGANVTVTQGGSTPTGASPKFQVTFQKSFKMNMNSSTQTQGQSDGFSAPGPGPQTTGFGPILAFLAMIGMAAVGYFVYLWLTHPAK